MKKSVEPKSIDFSKGVRGKYYERFKAGNNLIVLDPDLMDTFPDSESVNEALRTLKKVAASSLSRKAAPRKIAAAR